MKSVFIFLPLFILSLAAVPRIALAHTQVNLSAPEDAKINIDIKDSSGDVQVTLNGDVVMTEEGRFEYSITEEQEQENQSNIEYAIEPVSATEEDVQPESTSFISTVVTSIREMFTSIANRIADLFR